ncbi:gamma-glutamyltranspeptidase/glutathione hydrolase [Paraburkholderia youngii]|uniref:gamma-glutamyltransferase family protein n=1 Tax=Paraburkholderia youngii TaxID=2782701 RepID=UPI003D224705
MRDFELPGRSEALGTRGMAAASHPQATLAALDVLKAGGNAVDAAITAAAVLAVVEPTQTGIGGDCFVLLKRPQQSIIALDGAGWACAGASASEYRASSVAGINPLSAHAVTVPGSIRTWAQLARDHGTRPWPSLLHPAIEAATNGAPVTERLARDWARQTVKLSNDADTARVFLHSDGSAYQAGELHRQPALAEALSSIASDGPDVFYEGWIAEDIVTKLRTLGGYHRADDFADWRPRYVTPISTSYRGYELWECPPSGQGIIALGMAAMLERFDVSKFGPLSAERFHLQTEVARLAYAERDHYLSDSEDPDTIVQHMLAADRIDQRIARIRMNGRMADAAPMYGPAHRDTIYLTVVDKDGLAVSFINSIFDDFGSGLIAPRSGILLHNRACGFVTDPAHPNAIAGRKRPMHTIIPAMLTRDGEAVMSFGVTGAHFQPLGQIQVLTNIVDYGMGIQEALDHPRMFAHGDTLHLEHSVPQPVWSGLRALSHFPQPAPNPLGTGQAIWIDRARGLLRGGADPRRDGVALGY